MSASASPSPSAALLFAVRDGETEPTELLARLAAAPPPGSWSAALLDATAAGWAGGPSDGELLRHRIDPVEDDPGDARNLQALLAEGEVLVYPEPGASLEGDWLAAWLAPFADPALGLVWEPGSHLLLRRTVWETHPFPRGADAPARLAAALSAAGVGVRLGEGAGAAPAVESRPRPAEPLSILYVVHGFPPDTWAGTEVYTLNLAREMRALGHRVAILARAPAALPVAEGGPPEFSVLETEFEGLPLLRLVHRLDHGGLVESWDQPLAVEAFREVLLRTKPDLVHFQHLIHLSADLVREARDFNLPTVLHCHDYWAICARVQLIRPDGTRCEGNMGSGCFPCVRGEHLEAVDPLAREDPQGEAALARLAQGEAPVVEGLPRERAWWAGFGELMQRQAFVLPAYAGADLQISPSRFLRERVLAAGGFDPERFLYSDNGLATESVRALQKVPDPKGRLRFGFVGSLVWYKGCEVMVEAMRLLEGRDCALFVYGDFKPEEDAYHRELSERSGANVEYRGRFDNARLSEVYTEIDVLIVPSIWFENSPITIHEAYLAKTPVVASDVGGMAEYVRDGVDGLHFRVGEAEDLARVLARFLDEPDLLERLSRDWMAVKDIRFNALETEFRYRGLLCQERPRRPRLLRDLRGMQTTERLGPVEEQGADWLLLRPGGRVEYELGLCGGGQREVSVEMVALGAEEGLELGGRVFLNGRRLAKLPCFSAAGGDRTQVATFQTQLPEGRARLALDTRRGLLGQRDGHLRVAALRVGDPGLASFLEQGAR